MSNQPTSHDRLRWYQFRLRHLLLLMTLLSIIFAGYAWEMRRLRDQRRSIDYVLRAGGTFTYDYQIGANRDPIPDAPPPGPAWLRAIFGVDAFAYAVDVQVVCDSGGWAGSKCGANDTEYLTGLPRLRRLAMGDRVTDAGLTRLGRFPELESLDLSRGLITDDGLDHLAELPRLRSLVLDRTLITDAGMKKLARLNQLESLSLEETMVTNLGVVQLLELRALKSLRLGRTQVTEAGVRKLQAALPNLEIEPQAEKRTGTH